MGINSEITPEITIKINEIATILAKVDPNFNLEVRSFTTGLAKRVRIEAIIKYPKIIKNTPETANIIDNHLIY
mgnify:CR=1 FL=1